MYPYAWSANLFRPDPNNPVVFKMWHEKGRERLVGSSWNGRVSCDGTTNRFDMLTGHKSPEGTLEITCIRNPLTSPPPGTTPFDYKLQVTVGGGGIQPTSDEFTYFAPDAGYVPIFIESKKAGELGWRGRITQEFYFRTEAGQYGRLTINWFPWQDSPTHLDWNCSINPSGSRNLER